jgi:acyl carrier protein
MSQGAMVERTRVEETIFALVVQAAPGKVSPGEIGLDLSLRRDLGLDSLGLATLLSNFVTELGGDPDELLDMMAEHPISTVADLVALARKVEGGATEGSSP